MAVDGVVRATVNSGSDGSYSGSFTAEEAGGHSLTAVASAGDCYKDESGETSFSVSAAACDPSDPSQYTQVGWDYKLQLSTLRTDKPSYLPGDRLEVYGSVVLSQRAVFLNEYCSKPYPIAYSDPSDGDPAQVIITVQGVSQSFRVAADGAFSATLYLRSDWTAGDYPVEVTATGPAGYNGPTIAIGPFTVHIGGPVTQTVTTVTWEYTTQTKTSVRMVTAATTTVIVTVTSTTTTNSTVTTVTTTVTGDP